MNHDGSISVEEKVSDLFTLDVLELLPPSRPLQPEKEGTRRSCALDKALYSGVERH